MRCAHTSCGSAKSRWIWTEFTEKLDRATQLLVVGTQVCISCCGVCPHRKPAWHPHHLCGPRGTLNADAFDEIALGPATEMLPPLLSR